jgi:short-subunit dehydrogenase
MTLRGRVVAITGASAGIGRALAFQCAAQGMPVALAARRGERLSHAVEEIASRGGRALAVRADVTRPEDMQKLVDRTLQEFGSLHALVCNAGIGYIGPTDETPVPVMQRLLDVNFMGTFHAVKAAVPVFRQQQGGHLLIVSSIVGKRGMPYLGAYSATKSAQIAFAEALRMELRGLNVAVTVVCPVYTQTEFLEVVRREHGFASRAAGPEQTADEVAAKIVRALRRPVRELYPYRAARALPVLDSVAPHATEWVIRHLGRRRPAGVSAGPKPR